MKSIIATYSNTQWVKDYRYSQEFVSVIPIYYKRDLDLLNRFVLAQIRVDEHKKTNCKRSPNEERNRQERRRRAIRNLHKLRAMCHRRNLFYGAWGNSYGQFVVDLKKAEPPILIEK